MQAVIISFDIDTISDDQQSNRNSFFATNMFFGTSENNSDNASYCLFLSGSEKKRTMQDVYSPYMY